MNFLITKNMMSDIENRLINQITGFKHLLKNGKLKHNIITGLMHNLDGTVFMLTMRIPSDIHPLEVIERLNQLLKKYELLNVYAMINSTEYLSNDITIFTFKISTYYIY